MSNLTRSTQFSLAAGLFLLTVTAGTVSDTVVQVTSLANQAADSTINWTQLGADQTAVSASFGVTSTAGLSATVGLAATGGLATVVCSAAPPNATNCSWTGTGLPAGSEALWTTDGANGGHGPVTLTFGSSIFGAGALIQADAPGQFTAKIQAFKGGTSLGSFTAVSDSAGDAVYIGLKDTTAAHISSVVFSLTACQGSCADFALGAIQLNTPSTAYVLNLAVTPANGGTISGTLNGQPASCSSTCSVTGTGTGSPVTLTATPAAGYTFASWTGCPTPSGTSCTATLSGTLNISATFTGSTSLTYTQGALVQNRSTGIFSRSVTVTNSGSAVAASAYVADGLPVGVSMVSPSGTTDGSAPPSGSPYLELGAIGTGGSVTKTIQFTRTGTQAITYTTRILGAGPR
jgi:hypothetical protein